MSGIEDALALAFEKHKESGCPGEMFMDHQNSLCCTKDNECPILLALLKAITEQN